MTSAVPETDADDIDLTRLAALQSDKTMVDPASIAALLNVTVQSPHEWYSRTLRWLDDNPGRPLPMHYEMLPVPDHPLSRAPHLEHRPGGAGRGGRPRWYQGTVVRWAQLNGRMAPDGTPLRRQNLGTAPALEPWTTTQLDIDFPKLRALQDSDDPVTIKDLAALLDMKQQTIRILLVQTRRYLDETDGAHTRPLPVRHDLFPLPDHPDSTPQLLVWRKGTVVRWAMLTERMRPDGAAQSRPRRGGVRGPSNPTVNRGDGGRFAPVAQEDQPEQ